MLNDTVPEVRASAVAALGSLLGDSQRTETGMQTEHSILTQILKTITDASPMVRRELMVALSRSVFDYQAKYVITAAELIEEERVQSSMTLDERVLLKGKGNQPVDRLKFTESRSYVQKSIYNIVWKAILLLSLDPHPVVSELGVSVVDKIMAKVLSSGSAEHRNLLMSRTEGSGLSSASTNSLNLIPHTRNPSVVVNSNSPIRNTSSPNLNRSSSVVSSLRNFFGGIPRTESQETLFPLSGPGPTLANNRKARPSSMINISSLNLGHLNLKPSVSGDIRRSTVSNPPLLQDPDSVLVKSDFYQWSCEYFKEPQMATSEIDDPGSVKFNERQWRKQRRNRVVVETDSLYPLAGIFINDIRLK